VDKLAYDLGGVAHVIVEPDRSFSFRLKDCCNANNPYGGALGVSLVGRPNILRIVPNRVGFDEYRFRQQVIDLISHRTPRFGLDWSGLSELKTHYIVEKLRNDRKTDTDGQVEQWIKTFESEIDAMQNEMSSKDEEITRLRNELAQLDQRKLDNVGNADKVVNLDKLTSAIAEVYPGEIGDRARALFKHQADLGSNADGGERGAHIFNMLAELISPSGNLRAFKDEIKKLSSDPKQLRKWLRQKSWNERDGNHIVMTPPTQLRGVHQLTLPKTASDHRAGKNTARDLVAAMGLQSLKDQSRT
jgi:hypothetical protein